MLLRCILFICLSPCVFGSQTQEIPLWPDSTKGNPSLTPYFPDSITTSNAGVVICPGGGYMHLAVKKEGSDVAKWLNKLGVTAFVLKYRHGSQMDHPVPMKDALRALAMVRARAKEWKVDPNRIGILGFSAGGHLASTAGTHYHQGKPQSKDPYERVSCRPDFMILIYAVISMKKEVTHQGSRRSLLGEKPDPNLVKRLSNELQVTQLTPPAFLVHAMDDRAVKVENTLLFYQALKDAKVPVEMHIYQKGGHGFGLGVNGGAVTTWPLLCEQWMKEGKIIP